MKTIALTKGYAAIVDDSDYEILAQHKWRADVKSHTVYAVRWAKSENGRKLILMHRFLVGDAAIGMYVDHRDCNGLNNQRANLRVCSSVENSQNRRLSKTSTTGYKGVCAPSHLRGRKNKYKAKIQVNGKHYNLGYFMTAELAHKAYCEAAKTLCGDFARLA
mgnify:CR=1 FL=1